MAQTPQYKPMVDKKAAEQMNLTVLRRLDPAVEELLATAGHVALYDFDIPTKKWARKDVEGSLFLVKRRAQPRFQFIILNKKSADNFVEDVMGNFQCEVNKPYLLYRNKDNAVVGIWFFDDEECDQISALLQRIATTFAAPSAAVIGAQANGGGAAAVPVAAATPPNAVGGAAAGAGWGAVEGAGSSSAGGGGDDGFWDHKVEVPAEVDMPGLGTQASSTLQPLQQAQQTQQEPPGGAAAAGAAGDNSLMRIFAGMKITPTQQPAQQAQQAQQRGAPPTGASPRVLPLLSPTAAPPLTLPAGEAAAAAPAPAAGAGATPPGPAAAAAAPAALPLLTPQFLKQAAAAPAPQPAAAEGAGQALLKQLQGRPAAAAAPAAPVPAPAAAPAPAPAAPVNDIINEAAERVLHSKVRAFLRGLAENEAFVGTVAAELRKAGLL